MNLRARPWLRLSKDPLQCCATCNQSSVATNDAGELVYFCAVDRCTTFADSVCDAFKPWPQKDSPP